MDPISQAKDLSVEDLPQEEIAFLKERGYGRFDRLVRTNPGGAVFPLEYRQLCETYQNFPLRSDDVVLMAYPRSGSTWTREILWAMKHIDQLHMADYQHVNTRVFPLHYDMISPYNELDYSHFVDASDTTQAKVLSVMERATAAKSPRILVSMMHFRHLHPDLLDTCKVVYVARNPKDVCLSTYHIYSNMGRFTGSLDAWVELFTGKSLIYGSYWQHLRQALARRGHQNLHVMFYEDMKTNFMKELRKLNDFLETRLRDDQLLQVKEHTEFDKMKARERKPFVKFEKPGSFFHKGVVGAWRSCASNEMDARMDTWIAQNCGDMDLPPSFIDHNE